MKKKIIFEREGFVGSGHIEQLSNLCHIRLLNIHALIFCRIILNSKVTQMTILTRMVQLPATTAIEYVAPGHFFPGDFLAGGTFSRGDFCPGGLLPGGSFGRGPIQFLQSMGICEHSLTPNFIPIRRVTTEP